MNNLPPLHRKLISLLADFALLNHSLRFHGRVINYLLMHFAKKSDAVDNSVLGTYKVLAAVITFPIWWVIASLMVTWALLAEASPVNELLSMHYLLEKLTHLPFIFVFLIFMYWWPNSAKLHLKLYALHESIFQF